MIPGRALVSLSGGMDSTAVLGVALDEVGEFGVEAVGFNYGSKHNAYELEAARNVAEHYGVKFDVIDLTSVMSGFKSDLLKSGGEVPEGYYEGENMRQTVVPGRNMIFLTTLAGLAESRGAFYVYIGIHAGDHFIYPDCRPLFFEAMKAAIWEGSGHKVRINAPFLHGDKVSIIAEGLAHAVPFELTRTCYKNQKIACGKCGSCQERLAAFVANGVEDPIEYETRELIPKI